LFWAYAKKAWTEGKLRLVFVCAYAENNVANYRDS
jgi:hypothetical protein